MKRLTIIVLVAVAAVWALPTWGADPEDAARKKVEKEVREVERQRVDALLTGDLSAMEKIWAEDYLQVTYRGDLRNRRHRVAAIKAGDVKYEQLKNTIDDIRVFGDTAIVTGTAERKWEEKGRKFAGTFRFSRVWVKQDGRWQLVHVHFTRMVV